MASPFEIFKSCAVTDVKTVAEFLDKYYRKDRYTGRGEEYAKEVLRNHEAGFKELGVDWISKHESLTGAVVAFYGRKQYEG